ncbi:hypothetical protein KIW84_022877 [Lathyrus oleraceus]|uniref:Uncharacterized protein n=1 Tax=Pisum sativum TaxID=3888 RepID=A0A9D4YFY8_PEA|nr:hypothetical protein KIW84_022877 [Pisum sativum]
MTVQVYFGWWLRSANKTMAKDAPQAANNLGEDFYKVILQEEPFKSTTVGSILKSYRWAPFVPVAKKSVMLTVLLLFSKYRLRNVPVIEPSNPDIVNFITQSAVVQGLEGCRGGSTALQPGLYLILDFLLCLLIRYTHNSCSGFCRVQLQKKTSECRLFVAFCSVFCYVLRGMFSAGFEVFPFVQVMLGRWYLVRPTAWLLFAVREFGFE